MMSNLGSDSAVPPIALLVPVACSAREQLVWRQQLLAELVNANIASDRNRSEWESVLAEAGDEQLPEVASGLVLLIAPGAPPLYVWATAVQSVGDPTALGDFILDTQFPVEDRGEGPSLERHEVAQGRRIGSVRASDGTEVLVQAAVTVATLELGEVGEVDVCLWFLTDQLDAVDTVLPIVGGLMHNPDLATYLVA